ncbi:tape measure protein [Aeromonas piscicola]|uniref:tape measure protein n=1 Tax=Aeromonas piscicola TaxID=600645 RepID=UPI0005B433E3|nr:tape measure protein [Aeromonas piscicola]
MATNTTMTASVVVNLVGNMAQRAREFGGAITRMDKDASQSLSHLRQSVRSTSDSIDSMGKRALGVGVLGITAAGYALKNTFLTQAKQMESYRGQLRTSFGKGGADDVLNWVQENARKTTFAIGDVIESINILKSFDLDPTQILPAFQDAAAAAGLGPESAKDLMGQFGQMWQNGKMSPGAVKAFTAQGLNPIALLAKETGKGADELMKAMKKGQLGRDALRLLVVAMRKEFDGASVDSMNDINGAISSMGNTWEQFQIKVMDAGVTDAITKQVQAIVQLYDAAEQSGQLDSVVNSAASMLKTIIEEGPKAARSVMEVASAINTVAEGLGGWETIGKTLVALYAANKMIRMGNAGIGMGKTAYGVGQSGVKVARSGWNYLRGRGGQGGPASGGVEVPGLDAGLQRVFVVNWPAGMSAGGWGEMDGGKRRKGLGKKGRGSKSVTPTARRTPLPSVQPNVPPMAGVGKALKFASLAEKGVPLLNAAFTVAAVASADNNEQRGEALGGGAGAIMGAAIGTAILPGIGTVLGSVLGDYLGSWLGGKAGRELDEPVKPEPSPSKSEIKVTLDVPDSVKVKSVQTRTDENAMAFYRGAYWGGS